MSRSLRILLLASIALSGVSHDVLARTRTKTDKAKVEKTKAADKGDSGAAVLPGGNKGKPINITANKLDYFDKEQKLIYTGDVIAIQGDSTLKSTVLTIFMAPKKKGGEAQQGASTKQVQHMIADGPVTLLQRDQVGTGDHGVYDKPSNSVVLTGNVVLTQGPNITKGDKLTYDLKTGQAKVTGGGGRVKSMFIPDDDAGKPSASTTPAPEPATTGRAASRASKSARTLD